MCTFARTLSKFSEHTSLNTAYLQYGIRCDPLQLNLNSLLQASFAFCVRLVSTASFTALLLEAKQRKNSQLTKVCIPSSFFSRVEFISTALVERVFENSAFLNKIQDELFCCVLIMKYPKCFCFTSNKRYDTLQSSILSVYSISRIRRVV